MIVDHFEEVLKKTSLLLPLPTATATASATHVAPIPTVMPDTPIEQFVGDAGSRTLWVVFVLMLLASAGFTALSWRIPVSKRLYHVITTVITLTAALSYFAMATGHGVSVHKIYVRHQHDHVPDTTEVIHRQVFWARYVDWSITTPLLILDLGLLAGMNGAHITMAIIADLIMVLTGLFAAYGSEGTPQKWGWYTIACIAYIFVIWHLALNGGSAASAKGQKLRSFFVAIGGYTLLLWTAYPIVWGFADGSRKVGVDGEIIAYAVLDVLAKGVFGAWLLFTHRSMAETDVEVGGFWANGLNREGSLRLDEDGA
ncbi:family A G protein-coupled receptor-like protein [Dothidotthia symphoricarpi CBS 119687]|uniref:Family A G protein-coupled receptor-like protein n=1 Tax=Dothidotthia symphoricarpi CBS 119687 TaxID=1392245 RepID=A0A6A6AIT3_9PLEO|nr:family A G protein-coupled receptor-like protein [Dothidotthia symphoricarpi CBS 119687]KAF2131869.1 family A G protein-coupled receptor-like protein [Dothidotthia symphoricarpi CBS 119687]